MSATSARPTQRMQGSTMQRSAYRTSIAASASGGGISTRSANSAGGRSSTSGSPTTGQPPASGWDAREDTICDTWSGFVNSEIANRIERVTTSGGKGKNGRVHRLSAPAPSAAYVTKSNLTSALGNAIARQNEVLEALRVETISQRRAEEAERTRAGAAAPAGVENMLTASVLQGLLAVSMERWQAMLTDKIDDAIALEAAEKERAAAERPSKSAADSGVSSTAAPTVGPMLPSIDELYAVLLDGLNDDATRRYVADVLSVEVDNSGINSTGLITPFEPHVQAVAHWFPAIAPDYKALRRCFDCLAPGRVSCVANWVETLGGSSLNVAEEQLDGLMRDGDSVEALAAMLRASVHPSLRRLVYPRAFAVPLRVTDGRPPFPAEGEFVVNGTAGRAIPSLLTCASRYGRDKVARRYQHTFSALQEARTRCLQRMAQKDVLIYVGDSDRYFVYQDDADLMATALVSDRSVPVDGLKAALVQLGRSDALDGYVAYLRHREGDLIHRKAPPCGFVPVAGSSLFVAPVANITGDTVEQYELVSAMFGQLWGRLQGPTPELLQCCLIFEKLIADLALPATLHATRVLQTPPLRLALDWMLTGFANILDPFELLILWDWIAAYHAQEMHSRGTLSMPVGLARSTVTAAASAATDAGHCGAPCALWLLPIMAAGLFVSRAPLILKCRSKLDMEALFVSNHHVSTRPMIQAFLFTDAFMPK